MYVEIDVNNSVRITFTALKFINSAFYSWWEDPCRRSTPSLQFRPIYDRINIPNISTSAKK